MFKKILIPFLVIIFVSLLSHWWINRNQFIQREADLVQKAEQEQLAEIWIEGYFDQQGRDIEIVDVELESNLGVSRLFYKLKFENKSAYVLDLDKMTNRCTSEMKYAFLAGGNLYVVVDMFPVGECYSNVYDGDDLKSLFLEGKTNNSLSFETLPFRNIKEEKDFEKAYLIIGYIPTELVDDPELGIDAHGGVEVIEENGQKWLRTNSWGRDLQKYAIKEIPL